MGAQGRFLTLTAVCDRVEQHRQAGESTGDLSTLCLKRGKQQKGHHKGAEPHNGSPGDEVRLGLVVSKVASQGLCLVGLRTCNASGAVTGLLGVLPQHRA